MPGLTTNSRVPGSKVTASSARLHSCLIWAQMLVCRDTWVDHRPEGQAQGYYYADLSEHCKYKGTVAYRTGVLVQQTLITQGVSELLAAEETAMLA